MVIIYLIENSINDKKYVGQTTKSLPIRFTRHCWASEHKKNMPISCAIKKYGKDKFTITEIDRCETLEDANQKEVYWANYHNTFSPIGYNLKAGGRKYLQMSEETKQKISISNTGKKASPETIKKLSESHKGFKVLESTKQKLSDINKGKSQHPNTLEGIKQKVSKRYLLMSPVGVEVEIVNMKNFCKENNLQSTNMSQLVNGKLGKYKGWTFLKDLGYESARLGSRRNPLQTTSEG